MIDALAPGGKMCGMKWPLNQHWFCIVPLVPAALMIWIHEGFGLSDQMFGKEVGQPDATDAELVFNLILGLVFYAGIAGFIVHTVMLSKCGKAWLILKLTMLAAAWYVFLSFAPL